MTKKLYQYLILALFLNLPNILLACHTTSYVFKSNKKNETENSINDNKYDISQNPTGNKVKGSDNEVMKNPPLNFSRKLYKDEADYVKSKIDELLEDYKDIEADNGSIIQTRHPDGSKHSVDILNNKGDLIGKLVYLDKDFLHQLVQWSDGKQNGFTVFFNNEQFPYKIYQFKNNKLHGPYYEYKKDDSGNYQLVYYVEFSNNKKKGLSLGWTKDGRSLVGSKEVNTPKEWEGIP